MRWEGGREDTEMDGCGWGGRLGGLVVEMGKGGREAHIIIGR